MSWVLGFCSMESDVRLQTQMRAICVLFGLLKQNPICMQILLTGFHENKNCKHEIANITYNTRDSQSRPKFEHDSIWCTLLNIPSLLIDVCTEKAKVAVVLFVFATNIAMKKQTLQVSLLQLFWWLPRLWWRCSNDDSIDCDCVLLIVDMFTFHREAVYESVCFFSLAIQ